MPMELFARQQIAPQITPVVPLSHATPQLAGMAAKIFGAQKIVVARQTTPAVPPTLATPQLVGMAAKIFGAQKLALAPQTTPVAPPILVQPLLVVERSLYEPVRTGRGAAVA